MRTIMKIISEIQLRHENHFVKQEFLPKEILNERLWKGQENPSEHKLIEQMRRLWGDRYQN